MALDLGYRLALRADFDAEWFGEISTWVWSKLACGEARQAASALYECERANRRELGTELGALGIPNPFLIGPGIAAGVLAALTPLSFHRVVFTANATGKGLSRFYRARARRFSPKADGLYENLTQRHLAAFSTFKVKDL